MWPRSRESSITFNCLNLTFNTSNDNCMSSNLCNESKTSASDCNQQSINNDMCVGENFTPECFDTIDKQVSNGSVYAMLPLKEGSDIPGVSLAQLKVCSLCHVWLYWRHRTLLYDCRHLHWRDLLSWWYLSIIHGALKDGLNKPAISVSLLKLCV